MNTCSHIFRAGRLVALTCLMCFPAARAQQISSLPYYPDALGVSAPFAGLIGDRLIVGGGCNFPDVPAADGGKKAYYDNVYALDLAQVTDWQAETPLPAPLAYGATAQTADGLVCIGGQSTDGSKTDVYLMKSTADSLSYDVLPSLPVAIDNGGAACIGRTVYVTGGQQSDGACGLYALDLDNPVAWQRLADYPGHIRQQPAVLAAEGKLYLAGGFVFDKTEGECHLAGDILVYDPATGEWAVEAPLPPDGEGNARCLVGGTGVSINGRLFLTGGVNAAIFKAAVEGKGPSDYMRRPAAWYRFNSDILIYEIRRKSWRTIPNVEGMNRAGGALLHHNGTLIMVCGELKPGIRSPQVTTLTFPEMP